MSVLTAIAPELLLTLISLLVLVADLFGLRESERRIRRVILAMLGCGGCLAAGIWKAVFTAGTILPGGMIKLDALTPISSIAILFLVFCSLVLFVDTDFTEHVGEYVSIVLMAAVGMLVLIESENLLVIFLSFELTSLCLYALAGFRKDRAGAEAALKYFLFGGISAALTLFGISLVFGASGSLYLPKIASVASGTPGDALLLAAMALTIAGFGFKLAAAPFHFWAPDVYQVAPPSSGAIIASASKVAGFLVLAKVLRTGFGGLEGSANWGDSKPGWIMAIGMVAILSIVFGNLAALGQSNFRRMIAYSAVAHAGYALFGVAGHSNLAVASLSFYVITYGITLMGIFSVASLVENNGRGGRISAFAGLSRGSPGVALCLSAFMLSLAGLPPFAGFFAKLYVFAAVLAIGPAAPGGTFWMVAVALIFSVVSLYYYLQVLKHAFVVEEEASTQTGARRWFAEGVVYLCGMSVVVLGIFPNLLLHPILEAVKSL